MTRCDAIYIPTDNTFASAMPLVGSVVMESGTPVICGATGMVEAGGLITLGLNYYNLGYQTGEMAVQVLEGADPASMPVQWSTRKCFRHWGWNFPSRCWKKWAMQPD